MFEWLKVIADFAALILSAIALGGTFSIWRSNRKRDDSKDVETKMETLGSEISDVEEKVIIVGDRVSKIETALEHLPDDDDIEKLHSRISEVKNSVTKVSNQTASTLGVIQGMAEGMKTLQSQLQMLYDNELAEARAAKKDNKQ